MIIPWLALAALAAPPEGRVVPRPAAWTLEAGLAATSAADAHGTLMHLVMAARLSGRALGVGARLSWPALGGKASPPGGASRFWTWHGGVEALWSPAPTGWWLRPFLGAGPGLRLLVLDASSARGFQSDTRAQLAADVRGFAGIEGRVADGVTVLLRGDLGRAVVWAGDERPLLGREERFAGTFLSTSLVVAWTF